MGQVAPRQFAPPKAIGSTPPNGIVTQSVAAPTLPQNAFQPLIQNMIPTVQTSNAVPGSGVAGNNNYPANPFPDNIKDPYNVFGYDPFDASGRRVVP